MIEKLSLKQKLFLLCAGLCAVSFVVGSVSYFSLKDVSTKFDHIASVNLPNVRTADEMYQNYKQIRISLRTLGLSGVSQKDADAAVTQTLDSIAKYEDANKRYLAVEYAPGVDFGPGEKELYDVVDSAWKSFKETGVTVLNLHKSGTAADKEKITEIFFNECPEKAKIYTKAIEDLLAYHQKEAKLWVDKAHASQAGSNSIVLYVILGGLALGLTAGVILAIRISNSINTVSQDLASGAKEVGEASMQIAESSQNISQSATQQASSLEETVATMEELSAMIKRNVENAKEAAKLSTSTRDVAVKGEEEIQALVKSMQVIASDSKRIEEIITVIDDIAFQTNLLALNAAVEAARAGEQGKGFAVVAEAVRNLAQRSAAAAKDITELIKGSVSKVEIGSRQASHGGDVLGEIVKSVKKVCDLNDEISQASTEQSHGVTQIGKAMNQLDQVTQSNAAASEEAAASAEQLSAQSKILNESVSSLYMIVDGRRHGGMSRSV